MGEAVLGGAVLGGTTVLTAPPAVILPAPPAVILLALLPATPGLSNAVPMD